MKSNPMLGRVQRGDLARETARAKLGFPYSDDLLRRLVLHCAGALSDDLRSFFAEHCDDFIQVCLGGGEVALCIERPAAVTDWCDRGTASWGH